MISKNKIKHIRSLHQKKFRMGEQLAIAEGPKSVAALLNSRKELVIEVFALKDYILPVEFPLTVVTEEELKQISALEAPNQILAIFKTPSYQYVDEKHNLKLVLDEIKDPGNMGTIIRLADWFGITQVIASENCVEIYNPKVIQATMGSFARIKVISANLSEFLKGISKEEIYGALLEGENVYRKQLKPMGFLILGNESQGISETVKKFITQPLTIPSFYSGSRDIEGAESLNVAMACSIFCSEFKRATQLA